MTWRGRAGTLGVLVPMLPGGAPGAPEELPIGRVALTLAREGIDLVFGDSAANGSITGFRATPGAWMPARGVQVAGVYDRYPCRGDPAGHAALTRGLGDLPFVNPPALTLLCRDKWASQRHLERSGVTMPAVEANPAHFERCLREWGAGFLKPRFGAFGVGIRRVLPGDPLPPQLPGARDGPLEPVILQRAILPPKGWAGLSVRVLAQREDDGRWVTNPAVARRDREDPVVNVARGARAHPAQDVLTAATVRRLHAIALAAARALSEHPDGHWLAEVGVDCAIDAVGTPWVIEVNSRPRGRLEALARLDPPRFQAAHLEACARPLRFLAARSL